RADDLRVVGVVVAERGVVLAEREDALLPPAFGKPVVVEDRADREAGPEAARRRPAKAGDGSAHSRRPEREPEPVSARREPVVCRTVEAEDRPDPPAVDHAPPADGDELAEVPRVEPEAVVGAVLLR